MHRFHRNLFLGTCALALALTTHGQHSFESHLTDRLTKYLRSNPAEDVYLHLDRTYYVSGETIWLSLYLTEGTTLLEARNRNG